MAGKDQTRLNRIFGRLGVRPWGPFVLGGGVSNIARLYQDVPRLLGQYVFSDTVATPIRPACHGDSSGVRGAAWLWPVEKT